MPAALSSTRGAVLGVVVIVANLGAVMALSQDVSDAYRLSALASWTQQVSTSPLASDVAAVLFFVGCVALAAFARTLSSSTLLTPSTTTTWALRFVVAAAFTNGVGVLFPLVATRLVFPCADAACTADASWWLARSLDLDTVFNVLLGVGFVLLGRGTASRALGWATTLMGVLLLPVGLQFFTSALAGWLGVAGLLWTLLVGVWSVMLWRRR